MKRNFMSEALASLVIAAIVGVGSFFLCQWLVSSYWQTAFDGEVYFTVSVWAGAAMGAISGLLRWNVKK